MNVVEKLQGLHHQATEERSHYYVGSVALEAATEIVRLQEALNDALRRTFWEPIKTAPRDTKILLWVGNAYGHGHVMTGIAYPENHPDMKIVSIFSDGRALGFKEEPYATHWMPLPAKPLS